MDSSKRNGLLVGGVIGMTGFSIFLLGKKLWKIFFKKSKSSDKKSVCFEIGFNCLILEVQISESW